MSDRPVLIAGAGIGGLSTALTLHLPASIPTLRDLEVGRDVLHGARSWDVLLAMRFNSLAELREYQVHPAHQALMAFNDPQVAEVGSVDFPEN